MDERADLQWRRPRQCGGEATCVEVAFTGDRVLLRNSHAPDGLVAAFSRAAWADFVAAVKADEFAG
jgi:Domain of unknown function (DUF397)